MARKLIVEIVGDASSLEKTFRRADQATSHLDRSIGHTTRGIAAGSGVFRTLGRSLAFASGGFIAAASAADLIRGSIQQASEAVATQKQLATQFHASGQSLAQYRDRIDEATRAVSRLAGFEDDELTRAFITAFRGSENVGVALRIQATAADVARGRHIELAQATLALTKAYGGQATALRRLGILIPPQLHGLAALNFVQAKFAGQAAAGTTAQERFSAAFKNFEEVVGTALLPTFNNLLNSAGEWLNNQENQKKIQKDVSTGAKILGGALTAVGKSYEFLTSKQGQIVSGFALTKVAFGGLKSIVHGLNVELDKSKIALQQIAGTVPAIAPSKLSGQSTADRVGGLSPRGPGQFPPLPAAAAARQRASLTFQLSLLQLKLAQAELTATQKDDRAVLLRIQALTRQKLNQTKDYAKRLQLLQSLGAVQQQIAAIDAKTAGDRTAARQKELDARRKEAEKQQKFADRIKAENDKLQAHFRAQEAAFKARQAKLREALASAVTDVRNLLGGIFTGPVFNAPAGVLGITNARAVGGTVGASGFVSNLKQQTAQLVQFNNDLARLARRGAPGGLISQLRQGGLEQAPLIHQLATAGRPTLTSLFRAFAQQEKVVQQIAHADVQAKTVTIVTGNLTSRATTPSSQRRGRQAGIPNTLAQNLGF